MIRIADMTNVWENVISHLEGLGYDRELQILPNLYEYIEKSSDMMAVKQDALDLSFEYGVEAGYGGYDKGYEAGLRAGREMMGEAELDEAYEQGKADAELRWYEKGYEDGVAAGYKDGKADGIEEGYERGHNEGFDAGYEEGFEEGHKIGRERGYAEGFDEGVCK